MLKLKKILQEVGRPQRALAESLNLSGATVAQLLNHGQWPRSLDCDELQGRIRVFLTEAGANDADIANAFEVVDLPCANTADPALNEEPSGEDEPMLLPKQTLLPNTRKAFGLLRDPFDNLQCTQDMWLSPEIRYVREFMYQTARHGGFLAVVGQSGAGKSTLRRDLVNRITESGDPVIIIEPYVLASEDSEAKGKPLKSTHIAESMMAAVAPLEKVKSSPEARFAQLHKALKESNAAGYRHCLVIEEAHSLPISTLKHLKRFLELEVGFTKLISVIMIAQTELLMKLSERNADVREVVQRCERIDLEPIANERLGEFLKFRFERANKTLGEIIDDGGIQAISERLSQPNKRNGRDETVSSLYPLAIGNLVVASMNLAAKLGVPMITADIVKGV